MNLCALFYRVHAHILCKGCSPYEKEAAACGFLPSCDSPFPVPYRVHLSGTIAKVYPNGFRTLRSVLTCGAAFIFSSLAIADCFTPHRSAKSCCDNPCSFRISINFSISATSRSILAFCSGEMKFGSFHKSLKFVPISFACILLFSCQIIFPPPFCCLDLLWGSFSRFFVEMMEQYQYASILQEKKYPFGCRAKLPYPVIKMLYIRLTQPCPFVLQQSDVSQDFLKQRLGAGIISKF